MPGETFSETGGSCLLSSDNLRSDDWICAEMHQFINVANKTKGPKLRIEHFQKSLTPDFIHNCIIRVLLFLNLLDPKKYPFGKLKGKSEVPRIVNVGNSDIQVKDSDYDLPVNPLYADLLSIFPSVGDVEYWALLAPDTAGLVYWNAFEFLVPSDVKEMLCYIGEMGDFTQAMQSTLEQISKDVWKERQVYFTSRTNKNRLEVEMNKLLAQQSQMQGSSDRQLTVRSAEARKMKITIKKLPSLQNAVDELDLLYGARQDRRFRLREINKDQKDGRLNGNLNCVVEIKKIQITFQWPETETYRRKKHRGEDIEFEDLEDRIDILDSQITNVATTMDLKEQECLSNLCLIRTALEEKQAINEALQFDLIAPAIPNNK